MKVILLHLIVSLLSCVQSSVIPISTNPAGITIINAPPPGQSIAIQAPVVPNSIALAPAHTVAHTAVVATAEIPPSKIPAAVAVVESPATIPKSDTHVVVNVEGLTSSSNIPAAVAIAEIPPSKPNTSVIVSDIVSVTEDPETEAETPDPYDNGEDHNDDHTDGHDGNDDDSTSTHAISLSGSPAVVTAPVSTIVSAPAASTLVSTPTVIAGPPTIAGAAVHTTSSIVTASGSVVTSPVVAGAVVTSPVVSSGAVLAAAPSPAIIAEPATVLVPAEGTYLAKTRGSEHLAPLPGHINSASSINLEPAPGTI
ncbi:mucin-5AC-like [Condylostylus longicornis]|uniref:mucin-5AC-like n=1 Tax=Condylostylus longicornis TaxID=2530218 RepID=UPI00244E32B5|nr:mucin-5AC-like [Condylostylus longicornis]